MTDTIETPAEPSAEDIRARNKNLIFAALAEAGIRTLTVSFDGYGDSGQIEQVKAWRTDAEQIPLSTDADELQVPTNRKVQLASPIVGHPPVEMSLHEAIETLVYDYLEDTHMGWEDNEGSYGTFVFAIPERTITLEYNERYTEVHTTSHEF